MTEERSEFEERLDRVLNKLARWRTVFAGWQLGTRADDDPECRAVKHHREGTILQRAEMSALVNVLVDKGIFTVEEFQEALLVEATALDMAYEGLFPGFRTTEQGLALNPEVIKANGTMDGWLP